MRGNWSESKGSSHSHSHGKNTGSGSSYSSGPNGGGSHGSNYSSGTNTGYSQSSQENTSRGGSETIDYRIQPSFFAEGLRTGGATNKGLVDAVLFQPGQRFSDTGEHWGICTFRQ